VSVWTVPSQKLFTLYLYCYSFWVICFYKSCNFISYFKHSFTRIMSVTGFQFDGHFCSQLLQKFKIPWIPSVNGTVEPTCNINWFKVSPHLTFSFHEPTLSVKLSSIRYSNLMLPTETLNEDFTVWFVFIYIGVVSLFMEKIFPEK
jgi:hypothetical protein